MRSMTLLSYAKVNLFLTIDARRADGYHDLTLINSRFSLADRIEIAWRDEAGIALQCSDPSVPCDGRNTAHQAAQRFLHAAGMEAGVKITIAKRIPHGAGLGGGSSNAAAVLRGLNRLLGDPLGESELARLAVPIGADVPFFLHGGLCLLRGIGDQIEPIGLPAEAQASTVHLVLCSPAAHVSTGQAYRLWDDSNRPPGASAQPLVRALQAGDWARALEHTHNDFEAVIFEAFPALGAAYDCFASVSPTPPRLSGSGSNLFGLYVDQNHAINVHDHLTRQGYAAAMHRLLVDAG